MRTPVPGVYADSVAPIVEAGLAKLVERRRRIEEVKIQPIQKQPTLEDELRSEIGFSDIVGKSRALPGVQRGQPFLLMTI